MMTGTPAGGFSFLEAGVGTISLMGGFEKRLIVGLFCEADGGFLLGG
jgi:hypothetical protein